MIRRTPSGPVFNGDIDKSKARGDCPIAVALGHQCRNPPKTRRRIPGASQLVRDSHAIGAEGGERIVAIGQPVTFAMAAQVNRHRPSSFSSNHFGSALQRVPGLTPAVWEQHRPFVGVPWTSATIQTISTTSHIRRSIILNIECTFRVSRHRRHSFSRRVSLAVAT